MCALTYLGWREDVRVEVLWRRAIHRPFIVLVRTGSGRVSGAREGARTCPVGGPPSAPVPGPPWCAMSVGGEEEVVDGV